MAKITGIEALSKTKVSQDQAGYMELDGAEKDSNCEIVEGEVASELGCCNLYSPVESADEFRCGECDKVRTAKSAATKS